MAANEALPPGAWVAYNYDGSACVLFADELEALRYALPMNMPVHHVPFGHDAISGADQRPSKPLVVATLTAETDTAPAADAAPDVDVRETCSCGASLMLEGPFDTETLTEWIDRWRAEHPCRPGDKNATHIGAGASTERAWSEPHRSDSAMKAPLGFAAPRADGVWVSHWHDGADARVHPDLETARRLAETTAGEKIRFLPFGETLRDLLREARKSA